MPSAPEDAAEAKTEESLAQQAEILSGFPRRYATVEEVDEAIGKNRSRVSFYWQRTFGPQEYIIRLFSFLRHWQLASSLSCSFFQ